VDISLIYDIIVIGAGPAGSVTAATVAQAGYSVLLIERNNTCRSPCAGYISNTINIDLPIDSVIQSKIAKMRTYFPDLSYHDFEINGFVVDRPNFDMALVMRAESYGVEIKWDSPLLDIVEGGVRFHKSIAKSKIIVGADGVFSKTASLLGLEKQRIAVCAQYHIENIETLSQTCEIYFNSEYAPGGYVWVYPAGKNSAKVGVGVTKGSPCKYLEAFLNDSPFSKGLKTEYITGALPIGGLRKNFLFGNVLLVGDSAGMADPVTGAGINNAMLAAELAGRKIIKALENDDLTLLDQYETETKRLLGKPLARSLGKRIKLDTCYASNELLQERLPELWVSFENYWKERVTS
jgi:digeranylgeranylglycerophospholipid reductase